jgi:hypothetical protein
MSSSLSWSPPPTELKKHYIGLKYQIGRYLTEDYGGESGSWSVGEEIVPFLQGIIAVGAEDQIKDANELIAAIEKYGTIVLTIE